MQLWLFVTASIHQLIHLNIYAMWHISVMLFVFMVRYCDWDCVYIIVYIHSTLYILYIYTIISIQNINYISRSAIKNKREENHIKIWNCAAEKAMFVWKLMLQYVYMFDLHYNIFSNYVMCPRMFIKVILNWIVFTIEKSFDYSWWACFSRFICLLSHQLT